VDRFHIFFPLVRRIRNGGATALVELLPSPFEETKQNVYFWAVVTMAIYSFFLFWGRGPYAFIRKAMVVVAVVTVVALVVALFQPKVSAGIPDVLVASVLPQPWPNNWVASDSIRLVTAILFSGLGGFWSLFNCYWVLAERAGAARDNKDEFDFDNGAMVSTPDPETSRSWKRFCHMHVSIGVFGNYLTTLFMCMLAYAFLSPSGDVPYGWKLAVIQSQFFSGWHVYGPKGFLVIAALFLVDTWLTTLDTVSKVHVDMLRAYFPRVAGVSSKGLYYAVAIIMLLVTLTTMFWDQPDTLLLINGYTSAAATSILIGLVFVANFRVLPKEKYGREPVTRLLLVLSALAYFGLFVGYVVLSRG